MSNTPDYTRTWSELCSTLRRKLATGLSGLTARCLISLVPACLSGPVLGQTELLPIMPDAMPPAVLAQMLSGNLKLVGSPGLAWNKRIVTVAFKGGSDPLYSLIEQTASEWTAQGGEMQFSFREPTGQFRRWTTSDRNPAGVIRVSFDLDGYWSQLGVLALNFGANQPTLNLGGFPQRLERYYNGQNRQAWLNSYEHTTILHEFGHALGLSHEHFHPACQADMKVEPVIESLMHPPNNWTEQNARFNIDANYYFEAMKEQVGLLDPRTVISATIDRSSVMLYALPDSFFNSGARSPCKPVGPQGFPTALSASDRGFFLKSYGKITAP